MLGEVNKYRKSSGQTLSARRPDSQQLGLAELKPACNALVGRSPLWSPQRFESDTGIWN
jgi:hypothetical protein